MQTLPRLNVERPIAYKPIAYKFRFEALEVAAAWAKHHTVSSNRPMNPKLGTSTVSSGSTNKLRDFSSVMHNKLDTSPVSSGSLDKLSFVS